MALPARPVVHIMYLKHSIIPYPLRESLKSPVPHILRKSFKSPVPPILYGKVLSHVSSIYYGTVLSHLLMITRRHVKILFCALKRHVRILNMITRHHVLVKVSYSSVFCISYSTRSPSPKFTRPDTVTSFYILMIVAIFV